MRWLRLYREHGLFTAVPEFALTMITAGLLFALSGGTLVGAVLATSVLVTGTLLASWRFNARRQVTTVLRELRLSSQEMVAGDFQRRVPARGPGEAQEAALAFNTMREQLATRLTLLQENRDRMATVLSGMVEGVLAVDPQLRVLLANDACRALLGMGPRDVTGRPLLEWVRNLDVRQVVLAALRGGPANSQEITIATPPRRVVRVLATRLPGDPCPGVVVVLHDVTELRRLENLRRDFVANVSHELKTPLSIIKAYAETLRLGAIDDPDNKLAFVERIEEQAGRLHQLILDLLQLARVETGREAFEFSAVDLADAVRVAIQQHASLANTNQVTLSAKIDVAELPGELPLPVWADADGVRVILDNLVTNAIKYTPAGGAVEVRCRREGDWGILEVTDTGIGIPAHAQERIFERFFRVDKARSRDLGGTGLGLSIVKHLVQAFGGEVGLRSSVGVGSTFSVRLPTRPDLG